jgi:hypothetical protein
VFFHCQSNKNVWWIAALRRVVIDAASSVHAVAELILQIPQNTTADEAALFVGGKALLQDWSSVRQFRGNQTMYQANHEIIKW